MKNPIIVIAGPTASGKTALAVELAKKFNGEIVNADSRTVYKGMDVATSKPTADEMGGITHHLFDVVDPASPFTLADYKGSAQKVIAEIQERGKIPFLVGGTGLYIDAVVYDFNMTEAATDMTLRKELEKINTSELFNKLEKIDPITAEKIDKNNRRRLIRALEVVMLTEKSFVEQTEQKPKPVNGLYLAIDVPREVLYEKINDRIDKWENVGLIEETERLSKKYDLDLPAMSSIGYKEINEALAGKIQMSEALEIMKKRTRNYAKRQLTWFKRNEDINWIKDEAEAEKAIKTFLANK